MREVIRGLDGAAEPRGTCARGTAAVLVVRVAVHRELTGLELVFNASQIFERDQLCLRVGKSEGIRVR